MIREVYYLIVSGTFDRKPIRFNDYPSSEKVEEALIKYKGSSARVEKRYELVVFPAVEENDLKLQRLKKMQSESVFVIGNGVIDSRHNKCTNCGSIFNEFAETILPTDVIVPCCPICKANIHEYEIIPLDSKGHEVK